MYAAYSGVVVVVALRDLVACEFSVRRPRGGRSVVLLSSFHPQFDDSNTSTRFVPEAVSTLFNKTKEQCQGDPTVGV